MSEDGEPTRARKAAGVAVAILALLGAAVSSVRVDPGAIAVLCGYLGSFAIDPEADQHAFQDWFDEHFAQLEELRDSAVAVDHERVRFSSPYTVVVSPRDKDGYRQHYIGPSPWRRESDKHVVPDEVVLAAAQKSDRELARIFELLDATGAGSVFVWRGEFKQGGYSVEIDAPFSSYFGNVLMFGTPATMQAEKLNPTSHFTSLGKPGWYRVFFED